MFPVILLFYRGHEVLGVHFSRQGGIRRVGLPEKEHLLIEMLRAAVLYEFASQSLYHSLKHGQRPAVLRNN